jgi:hypothetical protein
MLPHTTCYQGFSDYFPGRVFIGYYRNPVLT